MTGQGATPLAPKNEIERRRQSVANKQPGHSSSYKAAIVVIDFMKAIVVMLPSFLSLT